MQFFIDGWVGNAKLWKVTWLGYAGMCVFFAIIVILFEDTLGNNYWWFEWLAITIINVWGLVAMWNCAPNSRWRGWFYVARVLVFCTAIYWALEVTGLIEA